MSGCGISGEEGLQKASGMDALSYGGLHEKEPVSRIRVTGPAPLILALTRTGDPGVNGILANPLGGGFDCSSVGIGGDVGVGSR